MKNKELIAELQKYDGELEIGGVVVSYTQHYCGDDRCYCSSEDHTFDSVNVAREEKPGKYKEKGQIITKLWIRGD